jgi:hypothetical protein
MQRCRLDETSEIRRVVMLCCAPWPSWELWSRRGGRALRDADALSELVFSRALWIGRWRRVLGCWLVVVCCSLRMSCAIIYYWHVWVAMLLLTGVAVAITLQGWMMTTWAQRRADGSMDVVVCRRDKERHGSEASEWRTLRRCTPAQGGFFLHPVDSYHAVPYLSL